MGWFEDNCYDEYYDDEYNYDEDGCSTSSDEICFDIGDKVKVVEDKKNFTEIPNECKEIIGKIVKIKQAFNDSDYEVKYEKKTFVINQKNIVMHESNQRKSDNEDPNSDALFQAIIHNNLPQVSALINLCGTNKKVDRSYPLIEVIQRRNKNIFKFLLEKKAKVNVKNYCGDTPLHCAVEENELEICALLLERGADVNSLDNSKKTPIMLAARRGYNDILRLLASREEADLTIRDTSQNTVLSLAIWGSRFDCVETLLDIGGCPQIKGKRRDYPFYIAVDQEEDSVQLLEILLKKLGSSIINNSECEEKFIHHVVEGGHVECLKILIKYGADINVRNELSQSPLHLAVKINNMDCVKILVENKADMELKDQRQLTPLHFGIYLLSKDNLKEMLSDYDEENDEEYYREMEEYMDFHPKEMRKVLIYLANAGAKIYRKNKYGKSPIEGCKDESLKKELLAIQLKEGIPKTAKIASIGHQSITGVKGLAEDLFEEHGTVKKICDREMCKVCNKRRRSVIFGCGHMTCDTCVKDQSECRSCSFSFGVKIKMID